MLEDGVAIRDSIGDIIKIKSELKTLKLLGESSLQNFLESEYKNSKYVELRHNDFMTKIKKELEVLKVLNLGGERNFSQSTYISSQNKVQPCFELNRDGMLQMLNSESTLVRYKTIEYINDLEKENRKLKGHNLRPLIKNNKISN